MTGESGTGEAGMSLRGRIDVEAATTLPRDDIFDLLQSGYRRAVLRHLDGVEGPVPLSELAAAVEARHGDVGFQAGSSDGMAVRLHQVHLPKLEQAGVIEYDEVARTVRLCEGYPSLFAYLYFEP